MLIFNSDPIPRCYRLLSLPREIQHFPIIQIYSLAFTFIRSQQFLVSFHFLFCLIQTVPAETGHPSQPSHHSWALNQSSQVGTG